MAVHNDVIKWRDNNHFNQHEDIYLQEEEHINRLSKAVENADYIVIAGVALIFIFAILFCCKEFYLCILNCSRERKAIKQREHVKLKERRSLEVSSTSAVSVQSDSRRYSRVESNLDIVEEDEEPPVSPGEGWKMTRWNSEEIVYLYPTESPLEDISIEEQIMIEARRNQKGRRVTWHNLGEGSRMSVSPSWRTFIQEIQEENMNQS